MVITRQPTVERIVRIPNSYDRERHPTTDKRKEVNLHYTLRRAIGALQQIISYCTAADGPSRFVELEGTAFARQDHRTAEPTSWVLQQTTSK